MKTQQKHFFKNFFTPALFLLMLWVCSLSVDAASQNIEIANQQELTMNLFVGDTGNIIVNDPSFSDTPITFQYTVYDESVLTITADGSFTAMAPGETTVEIRGYDNYNYRDFYAQVTFTVQYDMNLVTLEKTSLLGYMIPVYYDKKAYYNRSVQFAVNINSPYDLNTNTNDYYDDNNLSLDWTSSNSKFSINAYIENNILYIDAYSSKGGSTTLNLRINDKIYTINIILKKTGISNQSYLLVKGKTKKLTIKGYSGPVTWQSMNPKIATVSSKGVVKGKKTGNTIITAKIADGYLGCAVSVTSSKIKKVVERATYIGTHWKYSQAKRTQKGYYDCSALVWKAYKQYGKLTFGSPGYPSVALSEALWCKNHKRMIKGGMTYKKVQKMQVNPGDLLFKSSNMKKKYQDIYHVEMFTGYYCNEVSQDGVPYFSITWAARGSYYSWQEGSLLGRPLK